ncbi:MAG: hypothetical protein HGA87_01640 [Desulfobulbaceae bacterium]|nr:hypothetical protein [Desulfobulbaceae bacterium]
MTHYHTPVKIIKMKSGDLYLWSRDHYGDTQYAWTKCRDNNTTVIYPTATTWHYTKKDAWAARPKVNE